MIATWRFGAQAICMFMYASVEPREAYTSHGHMLCRSIAPKGGVHIYMVVASGIHGIIEVFVMVAA